MCHGLCLTNHSIRFTSHKSVRYTRTWVCHCKFQKVNDNFRNYRPLKKTFKKICFPKSGTFLIFVKNEDLRIISKKILRDFWKKHPDCEQQLKSWYQETSKSVWKTSNNIKKEYPSASFLINNRVVFNIKGNNYRLIVKITYDYQMIWIRFIGIHAEYDKINATKI